MNPWRTHSKHIQTIELGLDACPWFYTKTCAFPIITQNVLFGTSCSLAYFSTNIYTLPKQRPQVIFFHSISDTMMISSQLVPNKQLQALEL
jgi:hypothetical protein